MVTLSNSTRCDKHLTEVPTFWMDEDGRHFWWDHDCDFHLSKNPAWKLDFQRRHMEHGFPRATMLPLGPERWTVEQQEPLTVTPSILCGECGVHGFIREGQWVPA